MKSINRIYVKERIDRVYDVAHGAQALPKGIDKYLKDLRKAVSLPSSNAGDSGSFLADIGGGI